MGTVYVAVYQVVSPEELAFRPQPTPESAAFLRAAESSNWPYDVGDDPSFFCAQHVVAPLSWGICRRDLRGALEPGDTVAFIAHRKRSSGDVDYRWAGFATVAQKIKQTDIWEDRRYAAFRRYLNLLLRPDPDRGYMHMEVHPGLPHPDWLWRLTRSKGHRWQAKDFVAYEDPACEKCFVPGRDRAANGELIELSANYVIFSTNRLETVVLADPPVVAEHRPEWGPQRPELWRDTPLAQQFHRITLGAAAGRRSLRLTTSDPQRTRMQQRHRHFRIPSESSDSAALWREQAIQLLQVVDLRP